MISSRLIIWANLCFVIHQTQSDSSCPKDVLIDEYYTTAPTKIDKITEEDDKLAKAIIKSDQDPKVMISIFVFRDKIRRRAISQEISDIAEKYAQEAPTRSERRHWRSYWMSESYIPQRDLPRDLCHSMIFDENAVLAAYLSNFFESKDQTWIVNVMVLIKDLKGVIELYDRYNYFIKFKESRKKQDKPFENMLRVWVEEPRATIEKEEIAPEAIKLNAEKLKRECDDGGWKENRDQIELIFMKKSIEFSRLVIEEFEKCNGGKRIEDTINENIAKHDLKKELAYTYASLAGYIKNKHAFLAGLLDKYSDGSDSWAAYMLCIAVVHPPEWSKINEVFKKDHNGVSLSEFILQKMTCDKVVAEALAVLMDPKFKPTTFTEMKDGDELSEAKPPIP